MWTHLTNLQETADPFKQDIRSILEDAVLAKEFNLDARKFSRNYEGTFMGLYIVRRKDLSMDIQTRMQNKA